MTFVWQDDVTDLDAAHMNLLEQVARKGQANGYASLGADGKVPAAQLPPGIDVSGKVDKDSVVVAGTRVVQSKLLAGDANPAWRVFGNGKMEWGLGGANAPDVNFTPSLGKLRLTGELEASNGLTVRTAAGGQSQVEIRNGGTGGWIALGPGGGASPDSDLSRTGVNEISTGGKLIVRLGMVVDNLGGGNKLEFGPAADTNLYRSAASRLKTDGELWSGGGHFVERPDPAYGAFAARASTDPVGASIFRFLITASGRIQWGDGTGVPGDTNLYRMAAGALKTDGLFRTGSYITANFGGAEVIVGYASGIASGITFGPETTLYRMSASNLKTDGSLAAGGSLIVAHTDSNGAIYFGSALDTKLNRVAAGVLGTTGIFNVYGAGGAANISGLGLQFNGLAGLRAVEVGAPDSGGPGTRMLRCAN